MPFASLWVASRTVGACSQVCSDCLSCWRGSPRRSALRWFDWPDIRARHPWAVHALVPGAAMGGMRGSSWVLLFVKRTGTISVQEILQTSITLFIVRYDLIVTKPRPATGKVSTALPWWFGKRTGQAGGGLVRPWLAQPRSSNLLPQCPAGEWPVRVTSASSFNAI